MNALHARCSRYKSLDTTCVLSIVIYIFLFLHEINIVHKQRVLMNFIKKFRHFFLFESRT